jgi:two-component system, NtrC family, sensor kinase
MSEAFFDAPKPLPDPLHDPLDDVIERLWTIRDVEPASVIHACSGARDRARREENELAELVLTMTEAMAKFGQSGETLAAEIFPAIDARLAELGAVRWRMRLGRGVSVMYLLRSRNVEAREMIEQGIELARELGDIDEEAACVLNLANLERRSGNLPKSLELGMRAASLFEQVGSSRGLAAIYGNIGLIHQQMGELELALEYQERSLAIAEALNDQLVTARAYSNIGIIHSRSGRHEIALDFFERALAIRRTIPIQLQLAISIGSVALGKFRLGRHEESLADFEEALAIRRSINDREGIAATLGNIGNVLVGLERFDEAVALQQEGLAIAEELGMPSLLLMLHGYLADTFEACGRFDQALAHLRNQHRLEKEISGAEARRQVQALESARQVDLARKESEIERLRNVELASALADLKRAQAQLVHSEKMASLGQLTAGIAHEINNPINFIGASISPLRRDLRQIMSDELAPAERAEVLDEIERLMDGIAEGVARADGIVKGLRSFSRLDEDIPKFVDLREGIETTLAFLKPRLGSIVVRREYGDLPPVECYPGQINQATVNLLANAIDACHGEGTITVGTSVEGEHACLTFADTGAGILPEHLERIFEPFFTTRDVGKGTGLGLAITHAIVENHRGSIRVESTPGEGSRFVVKLPLRHE